MNDPGGASVVGMPERDRILSAGGGPEAGKISRNDSGLPTLANPGFGPVEKTCILTDDHQGPDSGDDWQAVPTGHEQVAPGRPRASKGSSGALKTMLYSSLPEDSSQPLTGPRGAAMDTDTDFDTAGQSLNIAPTESITQRILLYDRKRHDYGQQKLKENPQLTLQEAQSGYTGDYGLLEGNDATLESLGVEKDVGRKAQTSLHNLGQSVDLADKNIALVGALQGKSKWPQSVYTSEHLAEQCKLNVKPEDVSFRQPAKLPKHTPAEVKATLVEDGLTINRPEIDKRFSEMDTMWEKLVANGNIAELAELADLPVSALNLMKVTQELSGMLNEAWEIHRASVLGQGQGIQSLQQRLTQALKKENEREGKKQRRDRAEEAVLSVGFCIDQDQSVNSGDEQAEEEANWAWRYRRRKEREVPYAQQQGKVADALFRRLAVQLDEVKDTSSKGWGIMDSFFEKVQKQRTEFKQLQQESRDRISEIVPRNAEELRRLKADLASVEEQMSTAQKESDEVEERLKEMRNESELRLIDNLQRQKQLLAELRELTRKRDEEVHRRIEEIHKENKRKSEFFQFIEVARAHEGELHEAIKRTTAKQEWVDRVGNSCEACWPDIDKEVHNTMVVIRQNRIESQDHVLNVMHSANQCRSDFAKHKLQKILTLERTLLSCEKRAAFCRSTYDPQAQEHEAEVARLWVTLQQDIDSIRDARQTVVNSAPLVRDEEERLRKIPGGLRCEDGSDREIPSFNFGMEERTATTEEERWNALARQWGPQGRHDYSHLIDTEPPSTAAVAAANRRPASVGGGETSAANRRAGAAAPLGVRPSTSPAVAGLATDTGWGTTGGGQQVLQPGSRIIVSGSGRVAAGKTAPRPPLPSRGPAAVAAYDEGSDDEEECIATAREGNLLRLPLLEGIMF